MRCLDLGILLGIVLPLTAVAATPKFFDPSVTQITRLYYQGDWKGALDRANDAITKNPDSAKAYSLRAMTEERLGQLDQAMDDANHAVQLDGKLGMAYFARSQVKTAQGDFAGAADDDAMGQKICFPNVRKWTPPPLDPKLPKKAVCAIDRATIKVGEKATVTITLENSENKIATYPLDPGLRIVEYSETEKITPKKTEQTYIITLQPSEPGNYVVPAISIPQKGDTLVVPEVHLTVAAATAAVGTPSGGKPPSVPDSGVPAGGMTSR